MNDLPKIREWDGTYVPRFMLPKFDGHRVTIEKNSAGVVRAMTRTPVDITAGIRRLLLPIHEEVPRGVALIGELWLPGSDHSGVKTAINERDPNLRWQAFGILHMDGWTAEEIYKLSVMDVTETLIRWGVPQIAYQRPPIGCKPQRLLKLMAEAEEWHPDYEGYVLKDYNLHGMQKWKPVHTIDLIVSGYTEGQGKYVGQAGALILRTSEGYPVARCSGMSDEIRDDIDDSWIGEVVEVRYQTVTRKGRLRHPRFVRVREDKKASECDAYQQDRLIKYWHSAEGRKEMNDG